MNRVSFCVATNPTNAVTYRGILYLSLDTLLEMIDGTLAFTRWARGIMISAQGKTWEFANGASQLREAHKNTIQLNDLPLVLDGRLFIPLHECAIPFGYLVKEDPYLRIEVNGKTLHLNVSSVDSPFRTHIVQDLQQIHQTVWTTVPLSASKSLHDGEYVIPECTTLLLRRRMLLDGKPSVVATDCGIEPKSYVIRESDLRNASEPSELTKTDWLQYANWFMGKVQQKSSLQFGKREKLVKSTALTVDLCWSLRRFEASFFQLLQDVAVKGQQSVSPVIFVSGRWMEQHPGEMHDLIELSQQENVDIIWGLHSWAHPKSGGFLNDFSIAELRADTLRLEQLMLEWGIVPSVYYRFPGLIHDDSRLDAILQLDLFSIDCDAWLAYTGMSHTYGHPVQDGSIILVHGNGNEAEGIQAFDRWFSAHRDWEFRPLFEFLQTS